MELRVWEMEEQAVRAEGMARVCGHGVMGPQCPQVQILGEQEGLVKPYFRYEFFFTLMATAEIPTIPGVSQPPGSSLSCLVFPFLWVCVPISFSSYKTLGHFLPRRASKGEKSKK